VIEGVPFEIILLMYAGAWSLPLYIAYRVWVKETP
jgi:hypothetical protein